MSSIPFRRSTGAPRGARSVSLVRSRAALLLLSVALVACESGPEVVQNGVAQCIAHIKLPPRVAEPYCRCLGAELERNFDYATIRQYRLKTENWTYFLDVADDQKFMFINRLCLSRYVPEDYR